MIERLRTVEQVDGELLVLMVEVDRPVLLTQKTTKESTRGSVPQLSQKTCGSSPGRGSADWDVQVLKLEKADEVKNVLKYYALMHYIEVFARVFVRSLPLLKYH